MDPVKGQTGDLENQAAHPIKSFSRSAHTQTKSLFFSFIRSRRLSTQEQMWGL